MKLAEFQQFLRGNKIDMALLIHPDPNLTYFTSIVPSYGYLVITASQARLYLTKLDHFPKLKEIIIKPLSSHWEQDFKSKSIQRIGVNKQALTLARGDKLKTLWPKASLIDVSSELTELRKHKTTEEVVFMEKACAITTKALSTLLQELPKKRIVTERDVAFFLERSIREQGGELAFPTIVASGKNAAVPHHVPTTEKLQKGFLVLDFGAKYKNYCADLTRTIFLGTPNSKEKAVYNTVLKAQEESIKAVKEGILFKYLDRIARKYMGKYSKNFIHSLGHGIGLEIHEAPAFSDKKEKIKPNQVFTIEPGIYFPGKFGIRIEDTLVFDGKVRILTKFGKELIFIK